MRDVYIVAAVRTPLGSFGGTLAPIPAPYLGATTMKAALERGHVKAEQVNEVFFGNVLTANVGQAPARQAAIHAGIPDRTPCTTVNKVCASGMKSAMLGAQSISCGDNDIVMAGGMESMSNVPYYLEKARFGYKMGHQKVVDGMIKDGLWDVYNDYHMGSAAELCAKDCHISREAQDEYAITSYKRSAEATEKGYFKDEIVPVEVPQRKGDPRVVDEDEEFRRIKFEKVSKLRPVFQKDGTVTAANASTINDGAAALLLAGKEKCEELGLKPLARLLAYADAAQAPEWFTTSPAKAIPRALEKAKLSAKAVDFYEINEAFSVVALANNKALKLDPEKVNVYGGAVSLGHPLGCSGARIVVTLLSVLRNNNAKTGVAGICNGGGGASAMVVERL